MLAIGLVSHLLATSLLSRYITPMLIIRMTAIVLLYSAALTYNGLYGSIASGMGVYGGLFSVTTVTQGMEVLLFIVGALILLAWGPYRNSTMISTSEPLDETRVYPVLMEYSMIIIFTLIGSSLLMASTDLISLYIAIELQSFAVYILAALYRDIESATSAGLKYFLLGALSSALILLGAAMIYGYTGLTNLIDIYHFASIPSNNTYNSIVLGVLLITIGILFKVAAAPFHNWAPDVYDGVPTIVTTWLTIMPKIALFVFLLQLVQTPLIISSGQAPQAADMSLDLLTTFEIGKREEGGFDSLKNLLIISTGLSLTIGTVVGLAQVRIKRLMAYSTISHVGFLLLALSCIETEGSSGVEAFLFYIVQYSLTNLDLFIIILAFGYTFWKKYATRGDITLIRDFAGVFSANKGLTLSIAVCFFSMAGIPPLIGFFAKYIVLYTSISTHTYLSLVAILASVVSCAYYLRMVKIMLFSEPTWLMVSESNTSTVTQVHAFLIALLTMTVVLFVLDSSLLLNCVNLMALSLFV